MINGYDIGKMVTIDGTLRSESTGLMLRGPTADDALCAIISGTDSPPIDEYRDKILDNLAETVKDLDKDNQNSFKIVGKDEADMNKNLIYFKSPMGKSLIGKLNKDVVSFKTPSGEKNYEIIKVEYI